MEKLTRIFVRFFYALEEDKLPITLRIGRTLFTFLILTTFLHLSVGKAFGIVHTLTEAMGETVTMDDFTPTLAPGDTVIISPTRTSAIKLYQIVGSSGAWITFTNPSDAKITLSDDGSIFAPMLIINCRYIRLLGNNYASETYGIRLTGGRSGLRVPNTRDIEIAYLEIDTLTHVGLGMNQFWSPWDGTEEMENVTIHHNYIHDVGGEGMYLGKSSRSTAPKFRDIKVHNNIIENTGWDGIQLGQTVGDNNDVYNNTIKNTGHGGTNIYCWDLGYNTTDPCPGQWYGIVINPEHYGVNVYQNNIQDTYNNGIVIHSDADGPVYIHDNVVWNAGYNGISISSEVGTSRIINNTVVSATNWGISTKTNDVTGELRYNLLVACGRGCINSNYETKNDNKTVSSTSTKYFVDSTAGNFRLTENSPAKDAGVGSGYSTIDHDKNTRPASLSAPDIGAFEYHGNSPSAVLDLRIIIKDN